MYKIFITIDVEWDRCQNKNKQVATKNLDNIPIFQEICDRFNIRPIYFCTYEALHNNRFIHYLEPYIKQKRVEIGAHLHPWSNPPYNENELKKQENTSFPSEYSLHEFRNKLSILTNRIKETFGIQPVSYRAGRFGFVESHIPILNELGYKIDSSITPLIDWSNTKGYGAYGVDFSMYKTLDKFVLKFGEYKLLEFPISILPAKIRLITVLKRLVGRKISVRWFRIYPKTTIKGLEEHLNDLIKLKIKNIVFMMHSNEFHYRCNPYFTNHESVNRMFDTMKLLFKIINHLGIKSETLFQQVCQL